MKLIYVTSQKYPSKKVDPTYWRSMAEAFNSLLRSDFLFLVRNTEAKELPDMHTLSVTTPRFVKRTLAYFLLLPWLVLRKKWTGRGTVFFSADSYLLAILIFWRTILRSKYCICSDWHMMFDDWRDAYIANNSDYLITTTKKLAGLLHKKCGVDPKKILVAYGGVDTRPFEKKINIKKEDHRRALELPQDSFLVGYVGGFRSVGLKKGLDTMIKSLPHLREEVCMVFVGGSKQDISEYLALAKELHVEHRCIFVEKQPFEKVVEYELSMDVLAIPYPDQHHFRDYGFPLKVWEYMASGRPIVYSDLEIMGEVLEERATPFRPDDAASFANAVSGIQQDMELAEDISKHNPKSIHLYTWKTRAENILNFIRM